jgi:hypothetical protein
MAAGKKRASLYVRVSTDHQTVTHQLEALQGVAERRGWQIIKTYNDAGISGTKGRDEQPGLDPLLKDASRRHFDVLMAWASDRLGRSWSGEELGHVVTARVGSSIWKVDPLPSVDSTQMRPPCISTICLAIASPRPVTPLALVLELSTWWN